MFGIKFLGIVFGKAPSLNLNFKNMAKFKNDDSVKSLFDHAKTGEGIGVTYIRHLANVHPSPDLDAVYYAEVFFKPL
jgi:hypothetical protein